MNPKLSDWLGLGVLVVVWGTAFLWTEVALEAFSPSVIVAGRVVIGVSIVLGFLILTRRRLQIRSIWGQLALFALFGNVLPFHLISWGQQHIDSGTTGILMALIPLIVISLAHFLVPGERLTWPRLVGFGTGFVGVVWIIGPAMMLTAQATVALGQFAVLGGALCYSINIILVRRLARTESTVTAGGTLIVSSLLTLPLAFIDSSATLPRFDAVPFLAVVALGLFSTGIGSVVYFRLIRRAGAAFLSLINYLIPVWAVIVGMAFLGETPQARALIGLALVLAGIALSQWTPTKRRPAAIRSLAAPPRAMTSDA